MLAHVSDERLGDLYRDLEERFETVPMMPDDARWTRHAMARLALEMETREVLATNERAIAQIVSLR